jgi:type II secretory pathway pseudopilin PulG
MPLQKVRRMRFLCALRLGAGVRRRLADERGTTLSELLTVMAILGFIMAGLTSVFVSASHAQIDMTDRFDAQQQALLGLDKLRREIHCATSVTDTSGAALVTGSQYSAVVLTLPSYCATGQGQVTWCTRTSTGTLNNLYRLTGSTCPGTGGTKVAYALTTSQPFSLPSSPPSTAHLSALHVQFPIDVKPSSSIGAYTLVDDLVLRNSIRQ